MNRKGKAQNQAKYKQLGHVIIVHKLWDQSQPNHKFKDQTSVPNNKF